MNTSASAGVEFLGSKMRYVEIEHSDGSYRLLRLGDCDFEFDAYAVLFDDGPDVYLETISEAIAEVFEGSTAQVFRVAVHPPASRCFMSSVFEDTGKTARKEQLVFEAALLDVDRDVVALRAASGMAVFSDEHISSESTPGPDMENPTGKSISRQNHVSHISSSIQERLEDVFAIAGRENLETISSSEAVARVTREISLSKSGPEKRVMSVGVFDNYSMYSLMEDGEWLFSHQREETNAEDVLYFSMQMMRLAEAPLTDIGLVTLFGSANSQKLADIFEKVSGTTVQNLNPISVVDSKESSFQKDFACHTFTMCIGAAL